MHLPDRIIVRCGHAGCSGSSSLRHHLHRVQLAFCALLAVILVLGQGCHGDHHGIHCPQSQERRASGRFLNFIKSSKIMTCSLSNRKAPSTRINCASQACCTSSDCGAPNDTLSWLCACDGRCGRNRCFLVAGSCGNLPPPTGGRYIKEADGWVRLKCNKGYRRVGPMRRQCRNGAWTDASLNRCFRRCKTPPVFPNSTYILRSATQPKLKKFYIHGQAIYGKCKPGYRLDSEKNFLMNCRHGRWKPSLEQLACVEDPNNPCCELPTSPANGGVTFLSGRNDSLCRGQAFSYYCNECYKLSSSQSSPQICLTRDQVFSPPKCRPIACKVRDIPLPPGAIVNPDLIAEDAIYGCRATVSVRCRHAHDTSSRKLGRMQCHPNGSWIVPIREDQLHCTPSAVRDIRVEETSATSVRLSWLAPSVLANFTSEFRVEATQTNTEAGSHQFVQSLTIGTDDKSYRMGERYHVTITNLLPATQCDIKITTMSSDGVAGGMVNFRTTTNAGGLGPFRCEARGDRLFAVWHGSSFPSNATFDVSYMTTEPVSSSYLSRWTYPADNDTEVQLQDIQPFTDYNVKLEVTSTEGQEEHRINCSLTSYSIAPRSPPNPEVDIRNGKLVVTVRPSPDVFAQTYTLVVRKKSRLNIIQDTKKYDFTAEQVHSSASRTGHFEFILPNISPSQEEGETFDFIVMAATALGTKSQSEKVYYPSAQHILLA